VPMLRWEAVPAPAALAGRLPLLGA